MMKIQFKNVCPHVFEGFSPISDVWNKDFTFEHGMRYQLRGTSGKGKTSLLFYLLGYRRDYNGAVYINDKPLFELTNKEWVELRREKISSVFQDLQLAEKLTVADNISLIPKFAEGYDLSKGQKMLDAMGMEEKWDEKVENLSFGQKQRVAIARALCKPFELLICDEPFSHLDAVHKEKCIELIDCRVNEAKAGIVLTSLDGEEKLSLKSIHL
jgi:ABC-type lipoprotein export system ATPase subunit